MNLKNLIQELFASLLITAVLVFLTGCGSQGSSGPEGDAGGAGVPGEADEDETLTANEDMPGVDIDIVQLLFDGVPNPAAVGETLAVTFTVKRGDTNEDLNVANLDFGEIVVAGPSTNYQRILYANDVRTRAVDNGNGTWTYTFATPIPATYPAQLNDSASAIASQGELTGQNLLSGTYTVGLALDKKYTVEDEEFTDAGSVTEDFLLGSAIVQEPREVVTDANCNQCHTRLQVHGGHRVGVKYCLLCHTSGAEDKNVATVEGGTPDVSIDFRVLIHKIHNGARLPSVQGVGTNPATGARDYSVAAGEYKVVGWGNNVSNYSEVEFPTWMGTYSHSFVMLRDLGYGALNATYQGKQNAVNGGVFTCAKCHGDPQGAAPAPAQGDLCNTQLTRRACGSCHDDIDWDNTYQANAPNVPGGAAMPTQPDDVGCNAANCHPRAGTSLAVVDAHTHPISNPALNPGLNFNITLLAPGDKDLDGKINGGDNLRLQFSMTDDLGAPVNGTSLSTNVVIVVNGPTTNPNVLLYSTIANTTIGGNATFNGTVPEPIHREVNAAVGTGVAGQVITTRRTPIWPQTASTTVVWERNAVSTTNGTLLDAARVGQNYVDLQNVVNGPFANDDWVVIADGGVGVVGADEELLQVKYVDPALPNRLWFSSIYRTSSSSSTDYQATLRKAHPVGTTVQKIAATALTSRAFTVTNAALGQITITPAVTAGRKIIVSYTTDFIIPATYGPPFSDAPGPLDPATTLPGASNTGLDASWGEWAGMPIEDGTYTLGLWSYRSFNVLNADGTNQTYRALSPPETVDFLVGDATTPVPHALIETENKCYACHDDLMFHGGGRRGFKTCLLCHGIPAAEDNPRYVAAPTQPTQAGNTIDFRTMLHKIHMGEELPSYQAKAAELGKDVDQLTDTEAAEAYNVVGNSGNASLYHKVVFPAMPGAVKQCSMCHGTNNSWKSPAARDHSTGQTTALGNLTRTWRAVCGSCHDSDDAETHINWATNGNGQETCATCHGAGRYMAVESVHKPRYED